MNIRIFPALIGCALIFPVMIVSAKEVPTTPLDSYTPWSDESVSTFENILIQEGGRVKPLHTFSRFTLMQLTHGYTSVKFSTKDGEEHTVKSPAWLMDVLFRGDVAKDLPCFLVDNSDVVIQIGVSPKSKRDRYSYNELLPGRAKLAQLAAQYGEKQKKHNGDKKNNPKLSADEKLILNLGRSISSFEYLLGQFGFARKGELLVNESLLPKELKQLAAKLDMAEMLDKMPEMTVEQLFQAVRQGGGDSEEEKIFANAMRLFFFHASSAQGLSLFPPEDKENEEWSSIGKSMFDGLEKKNKRPEAKKRMGEIQALIDASNKDDAAFTVALKKFSTDQSAKATDRGEGKRSTMEVGMYHGDYFKKALVFFILAFVVMAFGWLAPGTRFWRITVQISSALVLIGILLISYGITLRCLIRSRPPITNLYDTIIFITAVAALLGLVLEYFSRIGVGLLVACVAGVLGMFLAINYEAKEATDTMGQLVAVLDTNFWLATHVIVINIGYGAGMLAALLAMVHLTGRFIGVVTGNGEIGADATKKLGALLMMLHLPSGFFTIEEDTKQSPREFYKTLTRMTYGVICFCLFFSLLGTVLGGIWANDSWGRFWGWDPKENGALMICLWCLVILHARMGGYIRDIGVNMQALVLGVIVTFSWFGVNSLGVGLHAYGDIAGVWLTLYTSWGILAVPFLMGIFLFFAERNDKKVKKNRQNGSGAEAVTSSS